MSNFHVYEDTVNGEHYIKVVDRNGHKIETLREGDYDMDAEVSDEAKAEFWRLFANRPVDKLVDPRFVTVWSGPPTINTSDCAAAPFLTFYRDGKRATLNMVDGKLQLSGSMEIDESARMLFDELCRIGPAMMQAWFGKPRIYDADMRKEDMYVVSTEPAIGKPQA